jgi:hypothetical protein
VRGVRGGSAVGGCVGSARGSPRVFPPVTAEVLDTFSLCPRLVGTRQLLELLL